MMKTLIAVLLVTLINTITFGQTFHDCRVGGRQYDSIWKQDATIVSCTNEDGKIGALAFPIDRFAFGAQCAVTKDELSNRRTGVTYSAPFTLRFVDGKWEMQTEQYSVCEAWLNQLPVCFDNHGKKDPGRLWKAADLWHGSVPCKP